MLPSLLPLLSARADCAEGSFRPGSDGEWRQQWAWIMLILLPAYLSFTSPPIPRPYPRTPVRAMAAEGSIGACSPPSMGPVPWMIKLLAVPISPVSGFVLKHQDPQRLPQVEPWLGRRASDCVVSGETAGPEVVAIAGPGPAALRESRPLPSQFSQSPCLVLGDGSVTSVRVCVSVSVPSPGCVW